MCVCMCGGAGGTCGWGTHLLPVRKNWMCGILGCNTKFYTDMPGVCVMGGCVWMYLVAAALQIKVRAIIVYNSKFIGDFRYLFLAPVNLLRRARTLTIARGGHAQHDWNSRPWTWAAAQQMGT